MKKPGQSGLVFVVSINTGTAIIRNHVTDLWLIRRNMNRMKFALPIGGEELGGPMMPGTNCRICGKSLSDYTSVRLGIGPICRAAYYDDSEKELFTDMHAVFNVINETPDFIFIKDVGHKDHITVTNDAQFVLAKLVEEYDLGRRRVFYIDSLGQIDEIKHSGTHFTGFKPGHEGVEL
jgi:hypothetical protein